MKISMYLGPSKYWWAYLGIQSNPLFLSHLDGQFDRAIFFDSPHFVPPEGAASVKRRTKYFYVLWDGIQDELEIDTIRALLGHDADLTALVVGDLSRVFPEERNIQSLYPEGMLNFNTSRLHFDLRTWLILLAAKVKAVLMPIKNILQGGGTAWPAVKLLLGKRKIVFCGSYGTIPIVVEQLCARHSIDFRIFDRYEFYCNQPNPSLESYRNCLRNDGIYLVNLYDRSAIGEAFFRSAVHLLGREYFIEKIRSAGQEMFLNRYGSGININVYTTPFYSQHTFIDFGSAVGTGNYPRLADLRYFKKNVVEIGMAGGIEELLTLARAGMIEEHFEKEWVSRFPQILRSMAEPA